MMYLFSWEEVPGNDSERLIEFLMQNFNIEWIKAAKINKTDDVKTIRITNDTNILSLKLNNEKNNVNIEIDGGRTDKFIVKTENDELNIYYFCILSIYFHGNNSKIGRCEKVETLLQYQDIFNKPADDRGLHIFTLEMWRVISILHTPEFNSTK